MPRQDVLSSAKTANRNEFYTQYEDIEKEVKGLVVTPEYEFACASTDTDSDFHNIGFAYLSQKVLPEEMRINNDIILI